MIKCEGNNMGRAKNIGSSVKERKRHKGKISKEQHKTQK
jgi:hypothetical protein